jgi:hypothetical protein
MDNEYLSMPKIVYPNGHFTPLVFVDLSVPTAVVVAGCTYVGREISKEVKDDKVVKPSSCIRVVKDNFFPIKLSMDSEQIMIQSVDDLTI